ncbi:hypothetical protein WKW50_16455 [Ochrobactrum sp. GPK 3]
MAKTESINLSNDWAVVADNSTSVAIQLFDYGRVEIYVGDTAPSADAAGIVIGVGTSGPHTFSAGDLPATAVVYARAVDNSARIVAMSY